MVDPLSSCLSKSQGWGAASGVVFQEVDRVIVDEGWTELLRVMIMDGFEVLRKKVSYLENINNRNFAINLKSY